jgi:hypothetical protein
MINTRRNLGKGLAAIATASALYLSPDIECNARNNDYSSPNNILNPLSPTSPLNPLNNSSFYDSNSKQCDPEKIKDTLKILGIGALVLLGALFIHDCYYNLSNRDK